MAFFFSSSHVLDPHTAFTKEEDMERLSSTHHSSSSIASSSHWSPPLPCPRGRSCCQCLLRSLITLYLFIFVCSYVVFLSINSAGKSMRNANSESQSLESELSHSTPSSVLCKLRDSSVRWSPLSLLLFPPHHLTKAQKKSMLSSAWSRNDLCLGFTKVKNFRFFLLVMNCKNIFITCNSRINRSVFQKAVSCRSNPCSSF